MTTNDQNPTAGIGDPYWYEWTIGQSYVVDMINPDSGIESVTLQATEAQGLDDVVILYMDGSSEFVQVKHTRKENTITFGNILPLLESMSKAWTNQKNKWTKCKPVLISNRKISSNSFKVKVNDEFEYERPALDEFLKLFKTQVKTANNLGEIEMPENWLVAWNEWCDQIRELPSDEEKLEFLKLLDIKGNQPGLEELTKNVTHKISVTFGISTEKAVSVFSQLDHALREWGTTSRGDKEFINSEDVYEVLSLNSKEMVGDHMLMPQEPFFPSRQQFIEDLAAELLTGASPITFLTGAPGQGKTNIVSSLANRQAPVIDLRFHAFKPITPQTEILPADASITTKAEVLWGDLLTQLRSFFFKGRLARFKVPIRNDFLSLDNLRSEVLRLANILGEERARHTIIAIDGIDHAARAGVDQYSFLNTLVPPDAVPEHVRFLIVGQPADAYPKYPFWLKGDSPGVTNWAVEGIQEEDISQLLAEVKSLPVDEFDGTLRLINEVAQGNTLAAIFAVKEAENTPNLYNLQDKLENRKLTDGLSTYYDNIWSAAVVDLQGKYPFVGQRLAGVLSLTNERVTGQGLYEIFSEVLNISPADWTETLRALSPLVKEEINGFRVIHNDIRVHLTKQIHACPERLREVASLIADFYWRHPEMGNVRHLSLFEMLRKSNRHSDQARAFTPEYVMAGFALGRPISELQDQCKQALLSVVETGDWDCIHSLSCASACLLQLHKSVDWTESSFEYTPEIPPILFSEGRVPNKGVWTLEMVYGTMVDAYRLIQANEMNRAYGLIRRWFNRITPIDFLDLLKDKVFEQRNDRKSLNETFKKILHLWGGITYHIGFLWPDERENYQTNNNMKKEIWALFSNGLMKEAIETGRVREWIWSRQVSVYSSISKIEENLLQLANKKRWLEVEYTLREWSEHRDRLPDTFKIKAAVLSLFTGSKDLFEIWGKPIADDGFNSLKNIDITTHMEEHTLLYCMVSFVLGWEQPFRENSSISEEGVQFYFKKVIDDSKKGHITALLRGSALAGKWLGTYKRRGAEAAGQIVTPYEVKQALEVLLGRTRPYNERVYSYEIPTRLIVEVLIECSLNIGRAADSVVYDFVKNYCNSYPVNYMMEICWRYLWARGDEQFLEEWFLHWCGTNGSAWHEDIASRFDIVNRLSLLADEIGFNQEAEKARHLLKWGMIGYTGHKEYVLDNPREWYRELAQVNPGIWEKEGKLLLEVCQEATETGDNRSAIFVESVVASSVAREGPAAMWRLMNAKNMREPLIDNVNMLFDGLISSVENLEISESDLLSIWSFGIGALNWQSDYDRCYLEDLRKALIFSAEQNGITSIEQKLKLLGPAEYYAAGNRNRYRIPRRWFEETEPKITREQSQTNEFFLSLKELTIESAIELLVHTNAEENMENYWGGICIVGNRLREEKPFGYPRYIQSLVQIMLSSKQTPYPWGWSNISLAYQTLLPLLRDNVRLNLLDKTINNLDFERSAQVWLESAAENLDELCRIRATATDIKDLAGGLHRHLALHEIWIQGNGYLPDMDRIEIPEDQQLETVPTTWASFAVQYFIRILKSNNLTRIELALRGLWSLAQVSPAELGYIVDNWEDLSQSAKERVLLLVERAAASIPNVYHLFSEVVQLCYKGTDLNLKLQAWVILQRNERKTGEKFGEWEFPLHPDSDMIESLVSGDRGVLDIPSIQHGLGYHLQGSDIIHSFLSRLEVVTLEDLEDIERKYVSYVSGKTPESESIELVSIHPGQTESINSPFKKYLMNLLYNELCKGRWREIPKVALAQALLTSDDPFVLLQSPSPLTNMDGWAIDEDLERLSGNKKLIKEQFLPHIRAGLSEDDVVLGAVLQTFSSSTDVEIVLNSMLRDKRYGLLGIGEKTTMNGRAYALFHSDRFEPQNYDIPFLCVTYKAGGIGEFINQTILSYPSALLTEVFNLIPSKEDNPLIWLEDGKPVLKFEYLHGPVRDMGQNYLHRQPFLQRWVCSKEVIENLKTNFDITISQEITVNVKRFRG